MDYIRIRLSSTSLGPGRGEGRRLEMKKMRERGSAGKRGEQMILRCVISEKAFILFSPPYLHFMSWPHCNCYSNMSIVLVFVCACVRVCVFIRGKLSVSFFPDAG